MAIDITTPDSPGWMLARATKKLEDRRKRLQELADYLAGNPPLPVGNGERTVYENFQKKACTNFPDLIVSAIAERIRVRDVYSSTDAMTWDADLQQVWAANGMDIEFAETVRKMLGMGDSYMIVGGTPDDVVVTAEDARNVVTVHDPARQSIIRYGINMFHDPDEGMDYCYLFVAGHGNPGDLDYEPARRYVATQPRKAVKTMVRFNAAGFSWDDRFGGVEGEPLLHSRVPIVRFRNRDGVAEFEPHKHLIDRINHGILNRLVIAVYQAFKARALKYDEDETEEQDEDGNPVDELEDAITSDPGTWMKLPKDAEIWESSQADMQGILSSVKDDIQQLAAVTRTSLSIFSPESANQSAQGASLLKEGQTFKTEDKVLRLRASLSMVFELMYLTKGEDPKQTIINFMPTERYGIVEQTQALAQSGRLPLEVAWQLIMQASPEQIQMWRQSQMKDLITGAGGANAAITGTAGRSTEPVPRPDGTGASANPGRDQ